MLGPSYSFISLVLGPPTSLLHMYIHCPYLVLIMISRKEGIGAGTWDGGDTRAFTFENFTVHQRRIFHITHSVNLYTCIYAQTHIYLHVRLTVQLDDTDVVGWKSCDDSSRLVYVIPRMTSPGKVQESLSLNPSISLSLWGRHLYWYIHTRARTHTQK